MTIDNAVSQITCFCGAFDIVFHNHKSFYHVLKSYCLSVPYYHRASHNCKQSYLEAIQIYCVNFIAMHLAA